MTEVFVITKLYMGDSFTIRQYACTLVITRVSFKLGPYMDVIVRGLDLLQLISRNDFFN